MKYSLYNSTIHINNKHTLFYNSFSGNFVVVKDRCLDLRGIIPSDLACHNHILYKQLIDAGMLIDESVDEIGLLNDRITEADNNEGEFILHINPTLECNFNCWYCYENHIPHSKMEDDTLTALKSYISNILSRSDIRTLELGFFGGEPLLYFNKIAKSLIEHSDSLCKKYEKNLHINFTSNGALLNDKIISFLSNYSCGFQITLDGGRDKHDQTRHFVNGIGSYDKITDNIRKLITNGIAVIVRVNYTHDNIDGVQSILDTFINIPTNQKSFIRFDFQRVWQDHLKRTDKTETMIREIRRLFRKEGFSVIPNYIPHDVRNSCYGDKKNHILINRDGLAFGCTARDFTQANSIGILEPTGIILYDNEKMKHRAEAKFSKSACRRCRIAPLCGGGCKQRAIEGMNFEGCTQRYTDSDIDDIILDIFDYSNILDSEQL